MLTIRKIEALEKYNIVSLSGLKVLLAVKFHCRMIDIEEATGLQRRSIEKILERSPDLFIKTYEREDNGSENGGAPFQYLFIQSKLAIRLLKDI